MAKTRVMVIMIVTVLMMVMMTMVMTMMMIKKEKNPRQSAGDRLFSGVTSPLASEAVGLTMTTVQCGAVCVTMTCALTPFRGRFRNPFFTQFPPQWFDWCECEKQQTAAEVGTISFRP